ncbi:MAG: 3-hydroxyacyl-CoA dehydrogenase NAD-binding domain-containing protein [Chlorobi bacterium]|nr:3-hydroxyacyl-CoA dehydrogenase NAD-binding domain-containing protein [Chlorobiota bacterium]MCI0716738.1 3-hydroxyacyl-CoA dehydrogenase NAD-binding domain-containing protein [Chlorobiota bacterium]
MIGADNIKSIGVIGAGTMGSGIASVSALSGFKTILYDVKQEALNKAQANILKGYDKLFEKGKIDEQKRKSSEKNIECTLELQKLYDTDFVIEAAIEKIELKKDLFKKLDEITKPDSVLATNTSSFSITEISVAVKNRARVAGMHFFNPANIMKLVEVVKGELSSDETLNITIELCKKLGKTPVVCMDTPAFIVNRIARAFYLEPLRILEKEKMGVETIDLIMKNEGGFSMGPFELMDLIGIDVNLSVTKSVYEAFNHNPKYKPSPIQQKMVDEGRLGRKTGQGFYKY